MNFDSLKEKDKELIKHCIINQSVSLTSEALDCKDVMSNEVFEKTMDEADRLLYLVNVLNGKEKYN